MKSLVLVLLVCCCSAFGQTIFVAGNNKPANDIRKQLVKDKGKSCLAPTDDPSKAELRMDVSEGNPGSGLMGLKSVAVSITDKSGVLVFSGDSGVEWRSVYLRIVKKLCH